MLISGARLTRMVGCIAPAERRLGLSWANQKGFTLIEMMIAVVILSLMLALAMPSYSVWIQNTRIRSAAESFVSGLQLARNEAVRRNSNVRFVVGTGSAWTVSCTAVTPGCVSADVTAIQVRSIKEGSSSDVTVVASDGATITFDSFGRMPSPTPSVGTKVTFNFDNTQLSTADSRDLRVTVDTGGNVRMCDPNVVSPDVRRC
jgi:type IV fimbrial biogenesis protein FimT